MNKIPDKLNLVRSNEIVEKFHEIKSDRAAAILAACHVEQSLKDFIQLYIIEEPEKASYKLLNTNNSIHNFSAMIRFAYECHWITKDIEKDLTTIRLIRNEFSHDPDKNEFSQIPNEKRFKNFSQIYDPDNLRSQYLLTVSMTVGQMWNIILPLLKKKESKLDMNDYFIRLGKLISILQSLEFILRVYLQKQPDSRPRGIPEGKDIYQYPVGSELPINEITCYDTLGKLIDKYNKYAVKQGYEIIDKSLVNIRDALAHGRVSSSSPNGSMRILKFSSPIKPNKDTVKVVFNEMLSLKYLDQQIHRVNKAITIINTKLQS